MSVYVEEIESREATKDIDGTSTGTRVFYERETDSSPNAVAALPSEYDLFPSGYIDVELRLKRIQAGHIGANETYKKYTLHYSDDVDSDDAGDRSFGEFATERNVRIGGQLIGIGSEKYEWDDGPGGAVPTSVKLFKRQTTGTIGVSAEVSDNDWSKFQSDLVEAAGKSNSHTFMSWAPGLLIFTGADLDEYKRTRPVVGGGQEKYWKVRLHFAFIVQRGIDYNGNAGVFGWNYFYDPENGWYRLVTPEIYPGMEFQSLLRG